MRLMLLLAFLAVCPAAAQTTPDEPPASPEPAPAPRVAPYDEQLLRLSEVLGSLHFLRRLCNEAEGPVWRNAMGALLAAEKPSPERTERMTARFNRGFGAFSRTYTKCTPAAVRASELYQSEGIRLTSQVLSRYAR